MPTSSSSCRTWRGNVMKKGLYWRSCYCFFSSPCDVSWICCIAFRNVYEYMIAQQKEKGKSKSGKGESFTLQQLQAAHAEYEEEATLCAFRLKSLKQGQSRSLLTQAARHHAAQVFLNYDLFRSNFLSFLQLKLDAPFFLFFFQCSWISSGKDLNH